MKKIIKQYKEKILSLIIALQFELCDIKVIQAASETLPQFSTSQAQPSGVKDTLVGFFGKMVEEVKTLFNASKVSKNPALQKDAATLLATEAKVPETLYVEYAGPKGMPKPSKEKKVSVEEAQNLLMPLPQAEEISDASNNPSKEKIEKALKQKGTLDEMKSGASLPDTLNQKIKPHVASIR